MARVDIRSTPVISYALTFALTGVIRSIGAVRARRIEDADTRQTERAPPGPTPRMPPWSSRTGDGRGRSRPTRTPLRSRVRVRTRQRRVDGDRRGRDDGFTITGDGEPPRGDPARYFDYGDAVTNTTTGTALPLVRTLAQVHGWNATIGPDYREGVRVVVTWAAPPA